jgi:hypothetical protein
MQPSILVYGNKADSKGDNDTETCLQIPLQSLTATGDSRAGIQEMGSRLTILLKEPRPYL